MRQLNLALKFLLKPAALAAFGLRGAAVAGGVAAVVLAVAALALWGAASGAWGAAFAAIAAANALLLTAFRQWEG